MLTTQDEAEKASQIDKVIEMLMKFDDDGNKRISQPELKRALADTGLLETCMGQNISISAVDSMWDSAVKSRACAVM